MAGHQVPAERRKVVVVGGAQKFTPNGKGTFTVFLGPACKPPGGVAAVSLFYFFIKVKHKYHKTDHLDLAKCTVQ